jgi:hypothetical protein
MSYNKKIRNVKKHENRTHNEKRKKINQLKVIQNQLHFKISIAFFQEKAILRFI